MKTWQQTRLKYVADANTAVLPEDTPGDFMFTYVDISNVTQGSMNLDSPRIAFADAPSRARRLAAEGDSVVSTVRTYLRAVATVPKFDGSLVFSTGFAVLHPKADLVPRFLSWYLQGDEFVSRIEANSTGVSYPAISAGQLMALGLQIPSPTEQRSIADYLDRETARIDTLIAEQHRLIEMLRERRQAQIDTAIFEASAKTVHLRRLIEFLTSGSRGWGDYYADAGERFLRIGNLPRTDLAIRGEVQYVDLPSGVTEGERTRLAAGDILFSITAYLGSVAVVEGDWVGGYVSQHVALCRVDTSRVLPRFLGWAMLSTSGQNQLRQGAEGGTKQQLALDDIRDLQVPLPSLAEQHRVAAYLDEQTAKIDTLIAETETFIDLARERRSALITAAVTGKIDVRKAA